MQEKRSEYYVYRYTDKRSGKVVYIGKTNRSLKARVNAHKREESFVPYDCKVDCVKLSNEVETDSVEKFLINYYKPEINLKDKIPFLTKEISLEGLEWIPYERYLETLRLPSKRRDLLKKEALTKVELVDTICESNGKEIVFPFIISTLPCMEGMFEFADQEVQRTSDGYHYTLVSEAKEYIENHYNEIMAAIWMPVVFLSNISDRYLEDFSACDYGLEVLALLKDFAYEGYQSEDYFERFVAVISSKYQGAMKYFEPFVGNYSKFGEHICFEWAYDSEEFTPLIRENICKDFVKLVRMDGIWDYQE